MIFGSEPNAPTSETFADYESYLEGDIWPSTSGAEQWVGDMPPQHAAAAIFKLRRWSIGQWSDEMRGEQEWAQMQRTRLYRHLAARATAQDFVDAANEPQMVNLIQVTGDAMDRPDASVALLYALAGEIEMPADRRGAEQLGTICTRIINNLYDKGYALKKEH